MPKTSKFELESPIRILSSPPAIARHTQRAGQSKRGIPGSPVSPFRLSRPQRPRGVLQHKAGCGPRNDARTHNDVVEANEPIGGEVIIQQHSAVKSAGRTARAEVQLGLAEERIRALDKLVSQLTRREHRLKKTLAEKGELLKDAQGEVQEARTQVVMAEERIDGLEALSEALRGDLVQYRGWWLTEYHSMKVVLGLLPDPDCVYDIAMSSKARFEKYSASG